MIWPSFSRGKVVVPFSSGQPAVPIEVAFDVGLDDEGVAGVVDWKSLSAELVGCLSYGRFGRASGCYCGGEDEVKVVDSLAKLQWEV